jgi:signal peptidase II
MDQAHRSPKAIALCVALTAVLTAADLGSKDWAVAALSTERTFEVPPACMPNEHGNYYMQRGRGESIELVQNYLEFRYAENCGAAFGMLDDAPGWLRASVFLTAGVVAMVALGTMFVRGSGGSLFAASVPLIVSGALGNMIDRVRLGYVVDFIHFHIYDRFEWPTFNVADITITVGVGLLLLDGLRNPEGQAKNAPSPAAPQTPRA